MKSVSPQRSLFLTHPFFGVVSSVVCMVVLFDVGGYTDAAAFMQIAPVPLNSELLTKKNGQSRNPYPMEVQEWQRQAIALYQEGKYLNAIYIQEKVLAWMEKHLGPNHPSTATSLNNLARMYESQGRYGEAEPIYLRALAIREKALGPDHPDTAASLNNLAGVYESKGSYGTAEHLYRRALAINEKALGRDHHLTGIALNNVASALMGLRKYKEAETLFARSLAIISQAHGGLHPDIVNVLANIATLYDREGKCELAMLYFYREAALIQKLKEQEKPPLLREVLPRPLENCTISPKHP